MLNIQERISANDLAAEIVAVVSSKSKAAGVDHAQKAGLPVHVVSRSDLSGPAFHDRIENVLADAGVELVCMAGFNCLWRIPPRYEKRVINIHPALLPDFGGKGFYGMRVHEAVLAAGHTRSGCTVHYCDNEYDHGAVILQRDVLVLPGDTAQALADRVFEQECIAYPAAIELLARENPHLAK